MSTQPDWRRAAARRGLVPLGLMVAGIVLMVVGGALSFWGVAVLVLGLVVATSLVFLEVGYSEDRERRREADARERREREAAQPKTPAHPQRRVRPPARRRRP